MMQHRPLPARPLRNQQIVFHGRASSDEAMSVRLCACSIHSTELRFELLDHAVHVVSLDDDFRRRFGAVGL
jgi:hypothetical protein